MNKEKIIEQTRKLLEKAYSTLCDITITADEISREIDRLFQELEKHKPNNIGAYLRDCICKNSLDALIDAYTKSIDTYPQYINWCKQEKIEFMYLMTNEAYQKALAEELQNYYLPPQEPPKVNKE